MFVCMLCLSVYVYICSGNGIVLSDVGRWLTSYFKFVSQFVIIFVAVDAFAVQHRRRHSSAVLLNGH